MQELKYPKICWNSLLLLIVFFVFCISCKEQKISYQSLPIDNNWFSPYVATTIEYKDSIYPIVIEEGSIFYCFPKIAEMKYRDLVFSALNDTFPVNDSIFNKIKKEEAFVKPIPWIKNLYDSGKDNFIRALFDDEGYLKQYYSYEENKYLIYLLFYDNIYMKQRQEDGAFYIVGRTDK